MISAIVQARIGSTRLRHKVLQDLNGLKLIDWILSRVKQSKKVDSFILAIPDTKENEILQTYALKYGFRVFKGSEQDVLTRFYEAAKLDKSNNIVRICADNPVVSGSEIDHLIDFYMNSKNLDYAYNHIPRDNLYPDGLGGEIVSFQVLEHVFLNASSKEHREHIFNYIWEFKNNFKIGTFDPPNQALHHPELDLDIDTMEELEWFRSLPISPNMSIEKIINIILNKYSH